LTGHLKSLGRPWKRQPTYNKAPKILQQYEDQLVINNTIIGHPSYHIQKTMEGEISDCRHDQYLEQSNEGTNEFVLIKYKAKLYPANHYFTVKNGDNKSNN
jgi:hypothetical protein